MDWLCVVRIPRVIGAGIFEKRPRFQIRICFDPDLPLKTSLTYSCIFVITVVKSMLVYRVSCFWCF